MRESWACEHTKQQELPQQLQEYPSNFRQAGLNVFQVHLFQLRINQSLRYFPDLSGALIFKPSVSTL